MKSQYPPWTVVVLACFTVLLSGTVHGQDNSLPGGSTHGGQRVLEYREPFDPLERYYDAGLFPAYEVEILHRTDENNDVIFPLIYNGTVFAFSLNHGIPLWRMFIGGDLLNPFKVIESRIILYDIYNRLYAVDLSEGARFWRLYLADEIKGRPIEYGEFLITPTQNGAIHFIDRASGDVRFSYQGEGEINAGLSISGHLIIVPYRDGRIVAYDIRSRRETWEFNSGGLISVQPVIRDGYIYFGSWDDTFYALDIDSGKPLWSSYVGNTITRDFLVFAGEIVLFFGDGEIVCLSRNRGEIKWVKYFKGVDFNYNYFPGKERIYVFIPDFIALDPEDGEVVFDYRERSFFLYKEMLFDNMVEGERQIPEEERIRLLSDVYFTVSSYPYLPPSRVNGRFVSFVTEEGNLYLYDLEQDFFSLKYQLP